jgi:uncharacterized membrane protein YfcA
MSGGGSLTGLTGLGMGEVANTVLSTKTSFSIHRSIGTSTFVLYVTVLAATITNLLLVQFGGAIGVEPSIPFGIALLIVPIVLIGGQIGPYLNSVLQANFISWLLVGLYGIVSFVTIARAI